MAESFFKSGGTVSGVKLIFISGAILCPNPSANFVGVMKEEENNGKNKNRSFGFWENGKACRK